MISFICHEFLKFIMISFICCVSLCSIAISLLSHYILIFTTIWYFIHFSFIYLFFIIILMNSSIAVWEVFNLSLFLCIRFLSLWHIFQIILEMQFTSRLNLFSFIIFNPILTLHIFCLYTLILLENINYKYIDEQIFTAQVFLYHLFPSQSPHLLIFITSYPSPLIYLPSHCPSNNSLPRIALPEGVW